MKEKDLEQYMTPAWVAELVVEEFFPHLTNRDLVLEPSCGIGAFLKALPPGVPAFGIEIDPELAAIAARASSHPVICGDFLTTEITQQPTVVIGNPPFRIRTVRSFLDKAWNLLPQYGQCGFILPVEAFQHTHTVLDLQKQWSVEQQMIPRDLWGRMLRRSIVFARFTKDARRTLVGFALYNQCDGVKKLPKPMRQLLVRGEPRKTSWRSLVEFVLEQLGGRAPLCSIYQAIDPLRHTENRYWKEKVRQVLQVGPFERHDDHWALAQAT